MKVSCSFRLAAVIALSFTFRTVIAEDLTPTSEPGGSKEKIADIVETTQAPEAVTQIEVDDEIVHDGTLGSEKSDVPVLVGEGSVYHLTTRVVEIPSGRVQKVLRHQTQGSINGVYELVDDLVKAAVPKPKKQQPRKQRLIDVNPLLLQPPVTKTSVTTAKARQPPKAQPKPRRRPSPPERQRIGTALQVMDKWNFIVVRAHNGSDLKVGDELFFIANEFSDRFRELKVSTLEGRNIIVEGTDRSDFPFIRSGEPVFRWKRHSTLARVKSR